MNNYTKYVLLILLTGLSACGDNADGNIENIINIQYSVTLTEVELNKKGSSDALVVTGLPVDSAKLKTK